MAPRTHHRAEIPYAKSVKTLSDAARFIDHAGFCVLFPRAGIQLPSLYYAVARRLPARWDKHAQLIWHWKDQLPNKRLAFYGQSLKGHGVFLSLELLEYVLATQETPAGAAEAESFYAAGRISHDALQIWQQLAQYGPLATLELRHACKMETPAGNVRFKKAMLGLQRLMIVTHSGAEQETRAWASNRFDLVSRAFPKQAARARRVSPDAARAAMAAKYRGLYPDAAPAQLARLFAWTKAQAVAALGV
jgi:hypothetical protein